MLLTILPPSVFLHQQRLALRLTDLGHAVTVELALSPELMISAAELAQPDVIICPFLTKRVPKEVYTKWMTLIVHPVSTEE